MYMHTIVYLLDSLLAEVHVANMYITHFVIQHGSKVTDHHIFAKLTKHWEEEYHKDMAALNVSK